MSAVERANALKAERVEVLATLCECGHPLARHTDYHLGGGCTGDWRVGCRCKTFREPNLDLFAAVSGGDETP